MYNNTIEKINVLKSEVHSLYLLLFKQITSQIGSTALLRLFSIG